MEVTSDGPENARSPIFNDAGPLERRLREMAERGELDLPTPHWHIHRSPFPGEASPLVKGKVLTSHRTREAAARYILDYPQRIWKAVKRVPDEVHFKKQHTETPKVIVTMPPPDATRYEAALVECRRVRCQLGLTEMTD